MYPLNEFQNLLSGVDEKKNRSMQLDMVVRLIEKLNERLIIDNELEKMVNTLLRFATDHLDGYEPKVRTFNKQKTLITDYVLKTYKITYKGYYTALFTAMGLIFGSAIGIFFITTNPALYAVGIGSGIAIGVSLGAAREKKASDEGLIY